MQSFAERTAGGTRSTSKAQKSRLRSFSAMRPSKNLAEAGHDEVEITADLRMSFLPLMSDRVKAVIASPTQCPSGRIFRLQQRPSGITVPETANGLSDHGRAAGRNMSLIRTESEDSIATIVMTHVEKRNALSEALIGEITTALEAFREQKVRVVVLRAPPGAKVWSAGHDVSEIPDRGRDPLGWAVPLRVVVRALQ